ncbi:hypothetical protein XI06_18585 [Bradyrhizobium sp. CCBAU 11434]|nr:hypothetical protein [Bradyrhizobium sp. CCBAU 11434]
MDMTVASGCLSPRKAGILDHAGRVATDRVAWREKNSFFHREDERYLRFLIPAGSRVGDFDLIFGASKLNLKSVDLPIRYAARTYGETRISRFRHGWMLLKMVAFAFLKIKAI